MKGDEERIYVNVRQYLILKEGSKFITTRYAKLGIHHSNVEKIKINEVYHQREKKTFKGTIRAICEFY